MRSLKVCLRITVVLVSVLGMVSQVAAEDVEKRFRIGVSLGFFNGRDEVSSDAANNLFILDDTLEVVDQYIDPRNDSGVFGNLEIRSGGLARVSAQYAIDKIFIVEASVGYQKTDVGNVEVQAQFVGQDIPDLIPFDFNVYRIPVGKLERVPLELSGFARFRPRTSLNPYVGGGFGFTLIGFEVDPAFDALSVNLDASRGGFARLTSAFSLTPRLISAQQVSDLDGARIDARDTWEWHVGGGIEVSFKRKWVAFIDMRYSVAARSLEVGFNGATDLGNAVPNYTDFEGSPAATAAYGAVRILDGGLVDGGSLQPLSGQPETTDCAAQPQRCEFVVGAFDGQVDPGVYYVQGGAIDYDGLSAVVGVRYTF